MSATFSPCRPRSLRGAVSLGLTLAIWGGLGGIATAGARREAPDEGGERASFAGRFGIDGQRRAIDLGGEERLRALRRLANLSLRIPRQVAELLDQWLTDEPKLSPEECWASVRTLAPLARDAAISRQLARIMAGDTCHIDPVSDYADLVPEVAALALAKSGRRDSTRLLGEWLRRPAERASSVRRALLAHPPKDISPLLEASGPATTLLVETLGDLGSPAAIPFLRKVVKRATADVQGAAAIALAKLGLRETQDLAMLWLRRSDSPKELLMASAFVLLRFENTASLEAFQRLAKLDAPSALALSAEVAPGPFRFALAEHLDALPDDSARARAVHSIAEVGPSAVPALVGLLHSHAGLANEIALALGQLATPEALTALQAAGAIADSRPASIGGLIVAALLHPELARATVLAQLRLMLPRSAAADRALLNLGLAALDESEARKLLRSSETSDLAAAAMVAHLHGSGYASLCLQRLHRLAQRSDRSAVVSAQVFALTPILAFASPRASLSHSLLQELARSGLAVEATARWQLQARRPTLVEARDLGHLPHPSLKPFAASLARSLPLAQNPGLAFDLLDWVQTEVDPERRAAMTQALRLRADLAAVREILAWHADYDPSALVRRAATTDLDVDVSLQAYWVSPPPPSTEALQAYWVSVEHAARPPLSVFVPHTQPTLVFIRVPHDAVVLDSDARHTPQLSSSASSPEIAFRLRALPHP